MDGMDMSASGTGGMGGMNASSSTTALDMDHLLQFVNAWGEMPDIEQHFGCVAPCEETLQHFMAHALWGCDGRPNIFPGGSWIGHMFPGALLSCFCHLSPCGTCFRRRPTNVLCSEAGAIFTIWATHWLIAFIRQYLECLKRGEPYRSRAYYRLFFLPEALESGIKFALPFLNMCLEVWLAHAGGYK
jgi:hypothetical protein